MKETVTSWVCGKCGIRNPRSADRCISCKAPRTGREVYSIRRASIGPRDKRRKASRTSLEMQNVAEKLKQAMEESKKRESVPPKGTVRFVVPNSPTGIATVVLLILGAAAALAVIKSLFV